MNIPVVHLGDEGVPNPSWQDVESFMKRLDGKSHTDVFIGDSESSNYMVISGGNDNRYIAVMQNGEDGFFSLSCDKKDDALSLVRVGGLDDYRKADRIQSLETVLAAAKTYYEEQAMDPRFLWVKGM